MLQRLKSWLRLPARFVYRLLRPFVRPIAFRLRAYFIDALHSEVRELRRDLGEARREAHDLHSQSRHEVRHSLSQVLHEAQDLRHYLRGEMEALHHASHAEQLKNSASLIQELQATRDFLEADILKLSADLARQLRAVSAQPGANPLASRQDAQPASQLDRIESHACAAGRRIAVNCGNDEILVRTEVGYLICHAADRALLSALIESGDPARGMRLLIERLLKPDDVFIDVGADIGLHVLAAARAMRGRGRIVAFEPHPATCRLLEKSVRLNGFSGVTEIHQAAVSTERGSRPPYPREIRGRHSQLPPGEPNGPAPVQIEVEQARIDDVVDLGRPVALIRIGAEGAELDGLESARPVILRSPDIAVIVEFRISDLRQQRIESSAWLAQLTGMGMVCRAINAETGMLEDWSDEKLNGADSISLLFARPESPALST